MIKELVAKGLLVPRKRIYLNREEHWQVTENIAAIADSGNLWFLIHIGTGEQLGQFSSLRDAEEAALAMEEAAEAIRLA